MRCSQPRSDMRLHRYGRRYSAMAICLASRVVPLPVPAEVVLWAVSGKGGVVMLAGAARAMKRGERSSDNSIGGGRERKSINNGFLCGPEVHSTRKAEKRARDRRLRHQ